MLTRISPVRLAVQNFPHKLFEIFDKRFVDFKGADFNLVGFIDEKSVETNAAKASVTFSERPVNKPDAGSSKIGLSVLRTLKRLIFFRVF